MPYYRTKRKYGSYRRRRYGYRGRANYKRRRVYRRRYGAGRRRTRARRRATRRVQGTLIGPSILQERYVIHKFRRFTTGVTTSTSGEVHINDSFNLSGLMGFDPSSLTTQYAAIYDQYKILRVQRKFIPMSANQHTTPQYVSTYAIETAQPLYLAIINDYDGHYASATLDDMKANPNVSIYKMDRDINWSVRPCWLNDGKHPIRGWIDTVSDGTNWYGTEGYLFNPGTSVITAPYPRLGFNCIITYTIAFKNRRK